MPCKFRCLRLGVSISTTPPPPPQDSLAAVRLIPYSVGLSPTELQALYWAHPMIQKKTAVYHGGGLLFYSGSICTTNCQIRN